MLRDVAKDTPEEIEIHAVDGHVLRAAVREPPRKKLVGVVVLSHAAFSRKDAWEKPDGDGVARFLQSRGFRTIAFDFRGHGESGKGAAEGGAWTYDDLVEKDLPAVVRCARDRAKKLPVVVVGHGLGGHAALASQAIGKIGADAIVTVASSPWMASLEPSRVRWAVKRGALAFVQAVCDRYGHVPARALRVGTDDESAGCFSAATRFATTGVWGSDDGSKDYGAALARMTVPVMAIASDGDRLSAPPACVERVLAMCGGSKTFERVRRGDDGRAAPGHMAIVTTTAARAVWGRVADWVRELPPR